MRRCNRSISTISRKSDPTMPPELFERRQEIRRDAKIIVLAPSDIVSFRSARTRRMEGYAAALERSRTRHRRHRRFAGNPPASFAPHPRDRNRAIAGDAGRLPSRPLFSASESSMLYPSFSRARRRGWKDMRLASSAPELAVVGAGALRGILRLPLCHLQNIGIGPSWAMLGTLSDIVPFRRRGRRG